VVEVEASSQILATRRVVSCHSGSAGRDGRETSTGGLCQQQIDRRPRVTTKRMQIKTQKSNSQVPVPVESVIHTVRGQRVILDADLARIYDVETRRLNEQVKRNADRFPDDFMFRLTPDEWEELRRLRSQNATLKRGQHRKYPPYAFTEHGALMAANILKSRMAVSMSIYVVRAFVRMREELTSRRDLEERLDQIEKILLVHDTQLKELFEKIRPLLLQPPEKPRKKIGFEIKEKLVGYGKRAKRKKG